MGAYRHRLARQISGLCWSVPRRIIRIAPPRVFARATAPPRAAARLPVAGRRAARAPPASSEYRQAQNLPLECNVLSARRFLDRLDCVTRRSACVTSRGGGAQIAALPTENLDCAQFGGSADHGFVVPLTNELAGSPQQRQVISSFHCVH